MQFARARAEVIPVLDRRFLTRLKIRTVFPHLMYSMAIRGQRFHIDLSSEDEDEAGIQTKLTSKTDNIPILVGDIKERSPNSNPRPPSLPQSTSAETGFPAHKSRSKQSTFKRSRVGQSPPIDNHVRSGVPSSHAFGPTSPKNRSKNTVEMGRGNLATAEEALGIDEENKQRIATMSPKEIEAARNELLMSLRPSLVERLLKKANIDDENTSGLENQLLRPLNQTSDAESPSKKIAFDFPDQSPTPDTISISNPQAQDPDLPPLIPPPDLQPASLPLPPLKRHQAENSIPPPTLDPSSSSFLSDLHETYFPSLPSNPSALAWMAPVSPSESSYSATLPSFPPSALRFDFRAHLLPPRLAAQVPVTKGLHHHASAPDAAGYTIPELAHLARSAVASQRCIAYQTLGRVLYKLGRGDFGREGEDLNEGLWRLIEEGKVLDLLVAEAGRGEGGNRSCWATATEAVWLWRKGGGRRWKAE